VIILAGFKREMLMAEEQMSAQELANKNLTQVIYGLYAASLIVGVTYFVAVVINYVKRDDVAGTWLDSHFTWQIRTFWYSLLYGALCLVFIWTIVVPIVLGIFAGIWFIYRIVKGWLRLNEGKPMYA
jgi:uncharacterized membrane protein